MDFCLLSSLTAAAAGGGGAKSISYVVVLAVQVLGGQEGGDVFC
jgi:hypothetical protein